MFTYPTMLNLKSIFYPYAQQNWQETKEGNNSLAGWFFTCSYSGTGVCLHYSAFFIWTTISVSLNTVTTLMKACLRHINDTTTMKISVSLSAFLEI